MTAAANEPMGEMNTTPLIDVLLVLLVMFIITIPLQSHAVKLDLPGAPDELPQNDIRNVLEIDRHGLVRWNGVAANDVALEQALYASAQAKPQAELQFVPDSEARYARVDAVLAMAKRAEVTRMGFVGNERYASF